MNENVPLDVYSKAFHVNSLYTWLQPDAQENIQVNQDTLISNVLEPETTELLRLCFWINKCKQIITDKGSFEAKFIEIKNSLSFQNQSEVREQTGRNLVNFGKIMKDVTIPLWERELHAAELVTELEVFRSNVSSPVPELMLAALVQEAGFSVRFIRAESGVKKCDLVIESYKTEVKTFLDEYKEGTKIESDLLKEIECTLKRKKAVEDINDSLLKKAEVIFVFLTFSSLAVGLARYTFEKHINFSLTMALNKSISHAKQNRLKTLIDHIPVVVFTTQIDTINCEYEIFFHPVSYPVTNKDNSFEADPDNLHLSTM